MAGIDDRIDEYRSRLAPNDREEFDERLADATSALSESEIRDELRAELTNYEEHLELVTAAASAFHQNPRADGYPSGYRFAFTEPLEEQNSTVVGAEGVSNADVLLVKDDEDRDGIHLCLVECKAGNSTTRVTEWIGSLSDIEETVESADHRDVLKSQLGVDDDPILHVEYVLLGKLITVLDADEARLADNYSVWGYDLGEQRMRSVAGRPRDRALADVMGDSVDAGKIENPIDFTLSDHPVIQLQSVVEELITERAQADDEHPFEFNRSDFEEAFDDELQVGFGGDTRTELVANAVDSLLQTGEEIGLFTRDRDRLNSQRDYRILFQGRQIRAARDAVKEKFLDHRAAEKLRERAFDDVKDEFDPSQSQLGDF